MEICGIYYCGGDEMSEVSDNKIIFKAPTAGVYKFDNGKVSLTAKAADGCQECFNLVQELLKEKEAYEKLKAQLEKCEDTLYFYASNWGDQIQINEDLPHGIFKLGQRAREYFKENNKGEIK